MRSFDDIYKIAADRKDGSDALEALLRENYYYGVGKGTGDDRWLAAMAKCIFQAGFSWTVIENKWDGFEAAFDGFDPAKVAFYQDEDLDRLLSDKGIVRNGRKIQAVIENARMILGLARDHGSAQAFFTGWPSDNLVGLFDYLKTNGSHLGGNAAQRLLRVMGVDGFMLSGDVVARLVAEGVVNKSPTSKRDLAAVQSAFNEWAAQSGRSLKDISRVLAMSV